MQNQPPAPSTPVQPLQVMPDLLRYWSGLHALQGGLLGLLLVPVFSLLVEDVGWSAGITVLAALLLALLLAGLGWRYARQRFAHYQGQWLAGEGVVLRSGVWWRNEAWVPMARLQHLDVNQGPLDRAWGMASLVLHTAGSHDHKTRIDGLPVAQAHALREALLPRVRATHE